MWITVQTGSKQFVIFDCVCVCTYDLRALWLFLVLTVCHSYFLKLHVFHCYENY